jgi:hypothetical protein
VGLLTTLGLSGPSFAQQPPVVYVAPIEGIIDLGLAPFVQRVLNEATDAGAAAVIFELNTLGGRVDAALKTGWGRVGQRLLHFDRQESQKSKVSESMWSLKEISSKRECRSW